MQTVELNLTFIPEVVNCQVTLRRRDVTMDCAILLTTARLIVATAIFFHIRFFQYNKFNKILI